MYINKFRKYLSIFALTTVPIWSFSAKADGIVIDKIYHPYVQALETEIEWRAISQQNSDKDNNSKQLYKLGVGQSINDIWAVEIAVIGESLNGRNFEIEAYDLEMKLQLTEQGEYNADWGVIFELERETGKNVWEVKTGLLTIKEWGRWVGTSNLFAIYEWGSNIEDEFETKLALQARYRYNKRFEPAIEFYSGQKSKGIGPVLMGTESYNGGKKLHWEIGTIFTISGNSNHTFRALLEYEF